MNITVWVLLVVSLAQGNPRFPIVYLDGNFKTAAECFATTASAGFDKNAISGQCVRVEYNPKRLKVVERVRK
jgi:hypothetical protein